MRHYLQEARTGIITIADIEPKSFASILEYAYKGLVPEHVLPVSERDPESPEPRPTRDLCTLIELYLLADRFGMEKLCNTLMDAALGDVEIWIPCSEEIAILNDAGLTTEDPLMKLLIREVALDMLR